MWKKGELVWVSLNPSDSWIPGQILDPSEPFGILVSFFDLMEQRYVPEPSLRSFERDFEALVADSWRFRHFVDRALQTHFWNISFRLWCSCQSPPYLDRGYPLPCSPLRSDSALRFARDMAVSRRVPLRRLAETNSLTAQILSFRRYTVDRSLSESVYEEVIESAKLMDRVEEQDWCLDPSNKMDCIDDLAPPVFPDTADSSRYLSLGDPLPKDIHCCSVDKVVQNWNPMINNSDSRVMKACATLATRTSNHGDAAHSLKSTERCLQVEESICLQNSESLVEDIIEDDTTDAVGREAPPDVMIETQDDITGSDVRTLTSAKHFSPLLDLCNGKAFLAKPVSFVVLECCKNLACSMEEISANPVSNLDINVNTLDEDEDQSDRNTFNGTRESCTEDALESHIVDVGQVSQHITPVEQLQDLEVATTVESKIREVDNTRTIGVKRKASRDKTSGKPKRRNKASQQSIPADKPQNLQLLKDERFADPKCLRMWFLSTHGSLPSKSELLKRFSVFGKIDASRTDVNPEKSSAKVVFLKSIDAMTAYQFVKKIKLGLSKVVYRLDAFE